MIVRYLYLQARYQNVRRFLKNTASSHRIQQDVLWEKLRRNADSAFGRDHGFADIRSLEDFRRQVPLTKYEYYEPYVERVKRGEVSAMFGPGTQLLMFALTSGTTDKAKYIPITQEFFREYRRGWNLWGLRAYRDHPRLIWHYNLQLSSDWQQSVTEAGIPCGNISGLAAETAPLFSRPIFIVPTAVMKIRDPRAKQYAVLRLTMHSARLGILMTANPSTLIELARLADQERETLVRDLFDGTLSSDFDIPGEVRERLSRRISRRHVRRARQLERLVDSTGALRPADFWPRLVLLAVWTGGSAGAYLPRLRQYFGSVPVRDHGLSASEGRITLPMDDETSAGLLDYVSQYFEFIPEDEHGQPHPTVLEAHELQPDHNYFVVLTTSSGFYRYDIHDLVRCVGFQGQTPLLEFLNKGAHISSVTGEKISEYQVATAVRRALEQLGLHAESFTLAPQWGDPPGYVLLIEPGPYLARSEELATGIDTELSRLNLEYANRLETGRLKPLQLREVPSGTWRSLREQRIRQSGGSVEQYKHICLVQDLDFLDRLPTAAPSAMPIPEND